MKDKIKSYKKKDGKTYYIFKTYLGIDPVTGKKVITTRRGFKTSKEAQRELNKLMYEFDQGLHKPASGKTYKDIFDLWLPVYSATIKESTLNRNMQMFNTHILPYFGHMDIDKINSIQCQRFYNDMIDKYVKGREIYGYASKCFTYAIQPLKLIKDNPFQDIYKTPAKPKAPDLTDKGFLEKEELLLLLDKFKEHGDIKWYAFFHLMAYTGMRRGEIMALTWKDIDLTKGTVRVNKTLAIGTDNKVIVSPSAKTRRSNRVIEIDPITVSHLKEWKLKQKVQSLDGIVFTNSKGSYIALPKPGQTLDRIYSKYNLSEEIPNVRITPHVLRHSHCCHLFDSGADIKSVQARMGHEDELTTLKIYNHFTDYRKEKSTEKYFQFMGITD